jgi:hypothetical protein
LNEGDTDLEGRRRTGFLKAEVELGFFVVVEISGLEVEDDGFVGEGEEDTSSGDGVENKIGGDNSNSASEISASDSGGEGGGPEDCESDGSSTGAAINGGSVERSSINLTDEIFVEDEE